MSSPNKPEKTIRIGSVSASVFVNESQGGRTFRSVNLQRRYKEGDDYRTSTSYNLSDLPAAVAVLNMALNHVAQQEAES